MHFLMVFHPNSGRLPESPEVQGLQEGEANCVRVHILVHRRRRRLSLGRVVRSSSAAGLAFQ